MLIAKGNNEYPLIASASTFITTAEQRSDVLHEWYRAGSFFDVFRKLKVMPKKTFDQFCAKN